MIQIQQEAVSSHRVGTCVTDASGYVEIWKTNLEQQAQFLRMLFLAAHFTFTS